MEKLSKSLSGLKIAGGQRRRLGRFILTSNIVEFTKKLILQVNALTDSSGQADVHFHVCCGLGGGTGAGTLIDVLAQIRRLFNTSVVSKFKITLYLRKKKKKTNIILKNSSFMIIKKNIKIFKINIKILYNYSSTSLI